MKITMSGQNYSTELKSTMAQLKIENAKVNALRKRRRALEASLAKYMQRHHLQELDGFECDKLIPKQKLPPKPKKSEREKKQDGIEYYRQIGIINPERCYEEFLQTQRVE